MDGLNGASSNSSQQQQATSESTSFVSNLTAVAPISSQEVDDFQSDAKWHLTPLEKASLDCVEMEPAAFDIGNNDQQVEQNIDLSQDDTADNAEESAQGEQQHEQHGVTQECKPHERRSTEKILNESREHTGVQSSEQTKKLFERLTDIDRLCEGPQEDKVSEDIIETGQSSQVECIIPPDVATVTSSDTVGSIRDRERDSSSLNNVSTNQMTHTTDIGSNERKALDTREDISASSNASMYLSQTSVDAQMEKVIDNAVELGGGQHFTTSFDRSEDKAKVLESIHREITSDRSSMDIMADIALQQLQLVTDNKTTSTVTPDQTVSNQIQVETATDRTQAPPNLVESKNIDLMTNLQDHFGTEEVVSEVVVDEQGSHNVQQVEKETDVPLSHDPEVQTHRSKIGATVEVFVDDASSSLSIPTDSEQIIPIVEEPQPAASPDTAAAIKHQRADITVEPVDRADEHADEVHLNPVVEEALSTEESDDNVAKPSVYSSRPDQNVVIPLNNEVKPVEIEPDQQSVAEPSRRRSGRARVVVEKAADDEKRTDVKKTPGRGRGSARKQHKEVELETIQEPVKEIGDEQVEDQPAEIPVETSVAPDEVAEQAVEEEKVDLDATSEKDSAPTRSVRAGRTRIPKKQTDFITPKEEPARKQAKRSRASLDNDLNRSYDAVKITPLIKLPNQRSRATISTSDPSTRPAPPTQKRKRSPSPEIDDSLIEKKYTCSECNFSTDRLNNMVFHFNKSFCPGKCQMVEVMKANIIKQQQTPKGHKNKRHAR